MNNKTKFLFSYMVTFLLLVSTCVIHAETIQPTPFDRVLIEARIWCDDVITDKYDYYISDIPSKEARFVEGKTALEVPVGTFGSGVLQISVAENGKIIETRKIVK